jgi:hypothetical protein
MQNGMHQIINYPGKDGDKGKSISA